MPRIGIIGAGGMGQLHWAAYRGIDEAHVVGVVDVDAKRAAETFPEAREVKRATSLRELLAITDIDIADVCVPTTQHVEVVTAALAAGKHVICEKPLARTVRDGEKIAAAVHAAQTFFMPAMCMRFWPEWIWLKHAVAEARFGRVLGATFRRVGSMPPGWFGDGELSGGAILDLHVHDLDFINYLFGRPRAVFSRGYEKGRNGIVHVATQYSYDDVPLVMAEGAWGFADGFGFSMRYTVNFENGTADFERHRVPTLLVTADGKTIAPEFPNEDGFEAELRYFVQCVQRGERPSVVTVDDALEALRIIDVERRSVASGQVERV